MIGLLNATRKSMPQSHSGYCTGLLIRAFRGSQVQFLPEAYIFITFIPNYILCPDRVMVSHRTGNPGLSGHLSSILSLDVLIELLGVYAKRLFRRASDISVSIKS